MSGDTQLSTTSATMSTSQLRSNSSNPLTITGATAIRASRGRPIQEHRDLVARLYSVTMLRSLPALLERTFASISILGALRPLGTAQVAWARAS